MIKKSTFRRIVFFITISVSYLSYRVVYHTFFDKKTHSDGIEIDAIASIHTKKSTPFKLVDDGSYEAPYSSSIENITTVQSGNFFSGVSNYTKKTKKGSKIDVRKRGDYVTSIQRPKSKSSGGGGGAAQDDYASGNGGADGGSGGGVASSGGGGGGSDDGSSGMNSYGLALNTLSSPTSSSEVTDAAATSNSSSGARLGISTTPLVGAINNSQTVQAGPPPPPTNPAPLDTNSIIFILMGAVSGVFILLKDSKKKSQVV